MTNYDSFPYWRCGTGFTIRYSIFKHSWSEDTKSQRHYLATSNYLDGAIAIFVAKLKMWLKPDDFKTLCLAENYSEAINEYLITHPIKEVVYPNCGKKMNLIFGKNGPFYGCSGYHGCHCTTNYDIKASINEVI